MPSLSCFSSDPFLMKLALLGPTSLSASIPALSMHPLAVELPDAGKVSAGSITSFKVVLCKVVLFLYRREHIL